MGEPVRKHRNKWVAALWSFFLPGVGQIYNRKYRRGIIIILSFHILLASYSLIEPYIYSGAPLVDSTYAEVLQRVYIYAHSAVTFLFGATSAVDSFTTSKRAPKIFLGTLNKGLVFFSIVLACVAFRTTHALWQSQNIILITTAMNEGSSPGSLVEKQMREVKRSRLFFGERSVVHLAALVRLGILHLNSDQFIAAESIFKNIVSISESREESNGEYLLNGYWGLGRVHRARGDLDKSYQYFENVLANKMVASEESPAWLAITFREIGENHRLKGNLKDAIRLVKKGVERFEKYKIEDEDYAHALTTLGSCYLDFGNVMEAEKVLYKALQLHDSLNREIGVLEHPHVATVLNNLGVVMLQQGRYSESEKYFRRALEILVKRLGIEHSESITAAINLSIALREQNKMDEARDTLVAVKDIVGNKLEMKKELFPLLYNSLGNLSSKLGEYKESEEYLEISLQHLKTMFHTKHPEFLTVLNNSAYNYLRWGKYGQGVRILEEVVDGRVENLGTSHPNTVTSLFDYSLFLQGKGDIDRALEISRVATKGLKHHLFGSVARTVPNALYLDAWEDVFSLHTDLALYRSQGSHRQLRVAEAFEVLQLARNSTASEALNQMAARLALGDTVISKLVREHQDLIVQRTFLDKQLIEVISGPLDQRDEEWEDQLRQELEDLKVKLAVLNKEVNERFPRYADLMGQKVMSLTAVQKVLRSHEALVTFSASYDGADMHVFMVRDKAQWVYTVDMGVGELSDMVLDIRATLEPPRYINRDNIKHFDLETSHKLYQKIFQPLLPHLVGIKNLIIVPDGPLESIPFGVLPREVPAREIKFFSDYRDVRWLAQDFAITTLPAVSSLGALRTTLETPEASLVFAGFGDPVLEGDPSQYREVAPASLFSRGPIADVSEVRKLQPLPGTADELRLIANSLEAEPGSIYLGENATESMVKSLDLSGTRVIAFATHGLISGELTGLAEPGLVLTPPETGTERDDGILTASEVAQLDLYPGLVILSACNTASSDGTPGAEGLSGLAKAFFYAGSKTLLVSHWAVPSEAANQLTTGMFAASDADASIGPAEALGRSMWKLIQDEDPMYAHPMFWAPFMVVGEGNSGFSVH